MDFAEEIKIHRGHPVIIRNTRKEIHKNQLTVSLATIPGLFIRCSFLLRAALDNNDSRRPATGDSWIEYISQVKKAWCEI
jgi:hypothetical protein